MIFSFQHANEKRMVSLSPKRLAHQVKEIFHDS